MQQKIFKNKRTLALILPVLAAFCLTIPSGCSDDPKTLEEKQAALDKLLEERAKLDVQIDELSDEILALDSNAIEKTELLEVAVKQVSVKDFTAFVEQQGVIESDQNIMVSTDMGGTVMQILVKEGQNVSKGQALVKLDDALIVDQIEELQTALQLATVVYEKQKNLWDQNIGSELQFLQAKNNKESLEKKLATANTQLSKATIKAPISGTIDQIFVKEGEIAATGRPAVRIVNLDKIKVVADVSESFLNKTEVGDDLMIEFPMIKMDRTATVTAVGQVINPQNRTFRVEATLDNSDKLLKPNMLAIAHLVDHEEIDALVIPTKYIIQDNGLDYVFVAEENDGVVTVHKREIRPGFSYDGETMIKKGLEEGETIVTDGFKDVEDRQEVQIVSSPL